jgi:hypothetical protein
VIANGSSNGCVWWWAQHLQSEDNEKVRIVQSYGLRSETVEGMLNEMMVFAAGTPCKNPFYQLNLSSAPGECLMEKDWDRARKIVEEKHGLKGQPYFMVMHTKHGEEHIHLIHGRIDLETGKTISDSHDARKNHAIARQIERELGLQKVIGPYDLEPGMPRPKRAPKRYESLRAFKSGIALADIEAEVAELRQQSQNGTEFQAALDRRGYILAHGDKVVAGQITFMIIDTAGNDHSLARRLHMPSREVNAFMRDVDVKSLPDIREAKALHRERKIEGLEADRATVREEIQWQEALDKAAIAKEEKNRQFVEPKGNEKEKPAAERNRTQPGGREEKVWPINPPQHQSWPGFEKAATEATRDDRTENLKGPAAKVWEAFTHSDNAKAYAAALDDKGIMFAAVTKEEAYRSDREAEFAKAAGNRAPRFREGEIVIVTEPPLEYRRDEQTFIPSRVHQLDPSLAYKFTKGLDSKLQGIDATLKVSDDRAQQRSADREAVRLDRATDIRDFSRSIPGNAKSAIGVTAKVTTNALGGIGAGLGKGAEFVGEAVSSLFAPKLSPEQLQQAERTQERREAEAEATLDYSRYTAEATQQRRQEENEREAARQRQRDEERGRDR